MNFELGTSSASLDPFYVDLMLIVCLTGRSAARYTQRGMVPFPNELYIMYREAVVVYLKCYSGGMSAELKKI